MRSILTLLAMTLMSLALACAKPAPAPVASTPLVPQSNERVDIGQVLILVDASGSVQRSTLFEDQKAALESFTNAMPDGSYDAGQVAFGGEKREALTPQRFSRTRMSEAASNATFLDKDTPLYHVLIESADGLIQGPGKSAVILFSDGRPTAANGAKPGDEAALAAARYIAESRTDPTCFHTIQTSDDPEGGSFLRSLARVTDCGSYTPASTLGSVASIHSLQRGIFLGGKLPPVAAAAPSDSDRDGVADSSDRCPNTPRGTTVSSNGCWISRPITFGFDSSSLNAESRDTLDRVADALREHESFRIGIAGYTDDLGSAAYNMALGQRRAESAARYLETKGVAGDRFDLKSFGKSHPRYPNDTDTERAGNRRVQFTRLPER
jgi:OOP family OmpA-OmpF porin